MHILYLLSDILDYESDLQIASHDLYGWLYASSFCYIL